MLKSFHPLSDYIYPRYVKDFLYSPFLIAAAMVATRLNFSLGILIAILVNLLAAVFAFLINDIEDREDDAESPGKRFKNPFGYKVWSIEFGYVFLTIIVIFAVGLSYLFNGWTLTLVTITVLIVGAIYSLKRFRLKSLPVIDVLAHTYFFGGSTMLYFILLPHAVWDSRTWLLLIAVFFVSAYSSLFNEYRDFEDDRKAKIHNSASYLGKMPTIYLATAAIVTSGILILVSVGSLLLY